MKKPGYFLSSIFAALALVGSPVQAQAPAKPVEVEMAPNVKGFRDLQKLDRQIVALSKRAQQATVCLVASNGRGSGSGVVVSEDGLILTAAHVTSSMPGGVVVIFPDGTRKTGKVLGADYDRDAAMVQIEEEGKYPFVELGESKNLKRNQWTVALGHSGGFDPMRKPPVRLGRVLNNAAFVVTDTAVVGGDSGGPLFDVTGRVIGIHSNIGVSLSENRHVPIEVFHRQWEKLKSGEVTGSRFNTTKTDEPSPDQPMLGVQLSESEDGILLGEIVPKSPAEKAGLKPGDLVKMINGKAVQSLEEMVKMVRAKKSGDELVVDYLRDGEEKTAKVRLMSYRDLMGAPEKKAKRDKETEKPSKKDDKKPADQPAEKKKTPSIDELLKGAAEKGGRLELTPELVEELGGMEKLMEEIKKRAGVGGMLPAGPDPFFASSLKALEPVMEKNLGTTPLVMVDEKPVALGTVVSANGRILTKDLETKEGEVSVKLGKKLFPAKVVQRYPDQDLALLKIEATGLRPVRFQEEEPLLGSILTASGAEDEPLGIGLLSVSGRAMSKVGFIGVQAGESDRGVLVARIVPGGAAAEAGLQKDDVITHLNGEKVENAIAFGDLIRGRKAGEKVEIDYLREGKPAKITAILKERVMQDNVKNDPRMKPSLGRLSEKTAGYPDALQHDIPLPPELCGGPLFNLRGKCVGINVSRAGRTKTYAIPADEIMRLLKVKATPAAQVQAQAKTDESKSETLEAIKAIRASLKQIEKRLDELEKAER